MGCALVGVSQPLCPTIALSWLRSGRHTCFFWILAQSFNEGFDPYAFVSERQSQYFRHFLNLCSGQETRCFFGGHSESSLGHAQLVSTCCPISINYPFPVLP